MCKKGGVFLHCLFCRLRILLYLCDRKYLMVQYVVFYKQIPVGHVKAELCKYNIFRPWAEEINRQLTSKIIKFNFVATALSKVLTYEN